MSMQLRKTARTLENIAEDLERVQEVLDDSEFDAEEFRSALEALRDSVAQVAGLPAGTPSLVTLPQNLEKNASKMTGPALRKKFVNTIQDAVDEVDEMLMSMREQVDEEISDEVPLLVGRKIS